VVPELKHTIKLGRFESEVPDFLEIQERCSTWLEAEAQHERVVNLIRGAGDEVVQLYPPPPTEGLGNEENASKGHS